MSNTSYSFTGSDKAKPGDQAGDPLADAGKVSGTEPVKSSSGLPVGPPVKPPAAPAPKSKSKSKTVPGWKQLQKLLPYVARCKGQVAIGMVALVAMGIVGTLLPLTFGVILDCLSGNAQPLGRLSRMSPRLIHWLIPAYQPGSGRTLVIYCVAALVIVALKGIFSFWSRWILIGVSRDIEYDLRNDLLGRLLMMDPEFYVRNRTGELMSRATNDLNQVRMVLGPGIMYSATTLITMFTAVVLMVRLSPSLSLWVLIPVPIVAVVVWYFGRVIHAMYERIQAALATLSAKAQENLAGVRVIRAYAQEDAEIRGFDAPNRDYVTRNLKLIAAWSMFMPLLTALIGLTFVLVLWFGGAQVIRGQISLGEFVAFYAYMVQLVFPMIALGFVTNIFQRGAASMGRLNYILEAQPAICDVQPGLTRGSSVRGTNGAGDLQPNPLADSPAHAAAVAVAVSMPGAMPAAANETSIRGEIDFRHLDFTYPTTRTDSSVTGASNNGHPAVGTPVLHDINLHIPAGSTLAIVGPTGSGKSTLAALIARLWEAPPGTLLIDGHSIRDWPLNTLRRAIGFVPQDTYLFSETVRENIAFGVESAEDQAILQAAETASIAGEIAEFPARYATMVGERGITLSGGQKQRAALARAVLRNPRILILDDALSSVDTDTEERILRGLKEMMKLRTTILISHRVSTVRHSDQIIVLREGRIVECGTHDELLALGGYYEDLYQKQLLEEELQRA
jgi:ATP-binding cassette, subfamily B, multidrug efflux pump